MISTCTDDQQWSKLKKLTEKIVLYGQVITLAIAQGLFEKALHVTHMYKTFLRQFLVMYLASIFSKPTDEIESQFGSVIPFAIARGGWYFRENILE